MTGIISDSERALAAKIADRAMIAGWDKAIAWAAADQGISVMEVHILLNKATAYNASADPSGRIHGLEDWKVEKRQRSQRASSFANRMAAARAAKAVTSNSPGSTTG